MKRWAGQWASIWVLGSLPAMAAVSPDRPAAVPLPFQVCHNVVKKAWAQTTRNNGRKQRQRRPSYCLRQSTGAAPPFVGSSREGSLAALEVAAAERETAAVLLQS